MSVEMIRMSVDDFEFVLKHINYICLFENKSRYYTYVTGNAMLDENLFNQMQTFIQHKFLSSNIIFSLSADFENV